MILFFTLLSILLTILFVFSPILLEITGLIPNAHWLFYFTFPIGLGVFIIIIFLSIFFKNKRRDKNFSTLDLKFENSSKKTLIKNDEKEFLLSHLDEFQKRIGLGKSYYITSFLKKKNSFNGSAFFGSVFWLGYRGLFKEFFFLLVLSLIFDIVIYFFKINIQHFNLGLIFASLIGIYGNYLYFAKLKKDIINKKKKINSFLGIGIVILSMLIYGFISELLLK